VIRQTLLALCCAPTLLFAQPSQSVRATTTQPLQDSQRAQLAARWADSVLATMSLRERVAQMVWPNLVGDYVSTDAPQWRRLTETITKEKVGGLLISVGSPIEIAAKLNALQSLSALPLLVSADLETGAGMRARGGYFIPNAIDLGSATLLPPNMAIGATGDTTLAYHAGRVTALEGRALGIHINYAPVLDVNNNAANPVINTRSYGEDPHAVARLGVAYIRGLQENGMIATGKHFPGHGDTDVNSHLALPVVTVSRARLDSVELVPFRAAINAGVGAIMTFHGAMPALDSTNTPGTLSRKVNIDLLRTQLGFGGLVVSDAMDMLGVLNKYGPVGSAKLAVAAGVDVLIQPPDAKVTIDAIVDGVKEKLYTEARITESARRILILKHQLGLTQQRTVNLDSLRRLVGDSANGVIARVIAERSITLVRDSLDLIPLQKTSGANPQRVLSITFAGRSELSAGTAFDSELKRGVSTLRSAFVSADDPAVNYAYLDSLIDASDVTIISSYVGHRWNVSTAAAPKAFVDWVARASARKQRVIVVAFGNPYLLQQIPSVQHYIVAWGGAPVSQQAAARVLLGEIEPSGQLPITIPPVARRGAGLTE
jgi:beta-N-acetylhexosaminidase